MTTAISAGLVGSTYDQIVDAMNGMIAGGMAFANGEDIDLLRRAEVYALVLKVVPPDILTEAALRLVGTEQFFPSAATWLKACDAPIAERQRMLQRVNGMIEEGKRGAPATAPFELEELHQRLAGMIASYTRHGKHGRAADVQRKLYDLAAATRRNTLDVPAWAMGAPIVVKLSDGQEYSVEATVPPPADAPPPEPLMGGITEPATTLPPEATRTPAEQQAIDQTIAGRQQVQGMVDDFADYEPEHA